MLVMSIANRRTLIKSASANLRAGEAFLFGSGFVIEEGPFTFWNPADKGANINLTNNNLTATASSGVDTAVRAADKKTSGKWFFQVLAHQAAGSSAGIGLAPGSVALNQIGPAVTDSLMWLGNGSIFRDEAFLVTLGTLDTNTASIAYDADAHMAWIRKNDEFWNADEDANPVTGMGGIDVSAIDAAGLYPAFATGDTGDSCTANFGELPYTFPRPGGFTSWRSEFS